MGQFQPRNKRPHPARHFRSGYGRKPQSELRQGPTEPTIHRDAQKLLADMGKPAPSPFVPDPFQVEALKKVMAHDVVVSAPTGSGKTWIALEATREYLSQGKRVWYATPLKALSNAKFDEFGQALEAHNVGILTGDRKENADAPVIVGTTEILRNQLYDAMHEGIHLAVDLVILDEAHYLGDPDRGVVWEEVLIYLPARVRLLLLSATISNAREIAGWLTQIRGSRTSVVYSKDRPVPLHVLFMAADGHVTPFLRGNRLFPAVLESQKPQRRGKRPNAAVPDINAIVENLRHLDLLPAIVFLKSRSDCDKALNVLPSSPRSSEDHGFDGAVHEHILSYPELEYHRHLGRLLSCRAAAHHAGQLPAWRLLIEKMMSAGHLDVIFSTSTVAAGVNFPARTVVLIQSDRFNGRTFVDMTATDLHQMSGRAGRRGMDKVGFFLVVPGKHLDISLVRTLVLAEPEALRSRISVNFSMVLNLLLSHDPEGVKHLLGLSFAGFHEDPRKAKKVHGKLIKDFRSHLDLLEELDYVDAAGIPTYDGRWAAKLRLDHPLLIAELIRRGEFNDLNAMELAALIAPFAMDKDREVLISRELWARTRSLWKRFRRMIQKVKPVGQFMIDRGFEPPPIMFWPSAAIYLWCHQVDWMELVENITADEGDLAMLVLRTADHLRQLRSLGDEMPRLADVSQQALDLILRPPLL